MSGQALVHLTWQGLLQTLSVRRLVKLSVCTCEEHGVLPFFRQLTIQYKQDHKLSTNHLKILLYHARKRCFRGSFQW